MRKTEYKKIAIYVPETGIDDIDLAKLQYGNPGIGGTQFLLLTLPFYFNIYHENEYEFVYILKNPNNLSTDLKVLDAKNMSEAAYKASLAQCNAIIVRPSDDSETHDFLIVIEQLKLDVIAWLHTTPKFMLRNLSKSYYVKRCIAVGRDQYETLRDHPVINKLVLIFNGVDDITVPELKFSKKKLVVFLGSLTFAKGFHILIRMWKKILKFHPDARLIVIGSAKLYDRSLKLGPLGIAEEKYERLLKKYILDNSGSILKSVSFMGLMGSEKFEIMSQACVGVANHPGLRETFCLGAAEFQLCYTPVVSSKYGGLRDTVEHKVGGFLFNTERRRLYSIIELLSDPQKSFAMGKAGNKFIREKFNYKAITHEWSELFNNINNSADVFILPLDSEYNHLPNIFREKLRIIKSKSIIFRIILPSIYFSHSVEYMKLHMERILYRFI